MILKTYVNLYNLSKSSKFARMAKCSHSDEWTMKSASCLFTFTMTVNLGCSDIMYYSI